MPKNYKVVSANRWGGEIKGKPDDEGYYMHSITLVGHTGEPIDYKSKVMPKAGDTLHGELVEYVSKAGNNRVRFETPESKKKDNLIQDKIVAQFALRLAVEHATDHTDRAELLGLASFYIDCVNELTNGENNG